MAKLWCLIKEKENQITFDSFVGLALKGLRKKKAKHKEQAKQSKGKDPADFHQDNHGLNCQSSMCVLVLYFQLLIKEKEDPIALNKSTAISSSKRWNEEGKLKG